MMRRSSLIAALFLAFGSALPAASTQGQVSELQQAAQMLSVEWPRKGRSSVRVDGIGARLEVNVPMSREELDHQIELGSLVQSIQTSNPAVVRDCARVLAAVNWTEADAAQNTSDWRYRVVFTFEGKEVLRFHVGKNQSVLFGDHYLLDPKGGWFTRFWEEVLARDTYAP